MRTGVANATMAVKEIDGQVVFLRKVVPGAADRSYGIQVAELAGLPAGVIARAREVLSNLEKQELDVQGAPVLARHEGESAGDGQILLFSSDEGLVLEKLREVDVEPADADRRPVAARLPPGAAEGAVLTAPAAAPFGVGISGPALTDEERRLLERYPPGRGDPLPAQPRIWRASPGLAREI